MKEYKVLAANEKTIQALKLASSIKGVTWTNGSVKPDLKYKEDEEEQEQEQFIHPFQMSLKIPIEMDEETEEELEYDLIYEHDVPISGVTGINIEEGRIQICCETQDRTYVPFYDVDSLPVSALEYDDVYYIVLALRYDPSGEGDEWDNSYFPCNVYYISSDTTTNNVPAVPGFQTIILGSIERETISGEAFFSLKEQQLVSDLFYDFRPCLRPFSITADSTRFEDGKLINAYTLNDFHFYVREGTAIVGEELITIPQFDFTCTKSSYVYCSINEDQISGGINVQEEELQFHDTQNHIWNYLIGYINFDEDASGLEIKQYICQQIASGADTYKIKVVSGDCNPGYLSGKFEFEDALSGKELTTYTKLYIGADPVSSNVSQPGLSGVEYTLRPAWLYKNIDDYDDTKEQYITNSKGNLKWTASALQVSGSIADWTEIETVSGGKFLRWKPEYHPSLADPFYFMASVSGSNQKCVLSGVSFGYTPQPTEKEGVLIWSKEKGKPQLSIPPPSSEVSARWTLVGEKLSGLQWAPYDPGGSISLSGSIQNIFEITSTLTGNVLRVKTEYDQSVDQFHFVTLESDGQLSSFTFYGDEDADGEVGIMTWAFGTKEPEIKFCNDEREDGDDWILAGDKENGLYWTPLFATISGEIYKVKIDESDPSGDFLVGKIDSASGSLLITQESDQGGEFLNLEINPDYFYSEDDSIFIEETEDGLNICVSSYLVQVAEGDEPDYLFDKLMSDSGSISGHIVDDGQYGKVSLDINPEYFFSSDGSIFIGDGEDGGLDFTISSYLVQTIDGDIPGFLSEKIDSASGSLTITYPVDSGDSKVNIEINPEYFTSSDGSISIEEDDGALDFTISSWLSMVNEEDDPGYLNEKFESNSGSIIINDEDAYLNFEINPGFFYSSDGTVMIEGDSHGIDFTIDEEGLSSTVETIISSQVTEMISSYVTEHFQELISSYFPSGAGLLYINNGQLSVIPIGIGVVVGDGSTLTFEEPEDCD